ncbi:hypothetical protein [Klebsiella aerogenes]|uniref:hypothetical protein n=1 Tax=Klebsiella aerogenes TaxID=548 RepID=UPI001F3EEFF8|nr:hypothetical protein [Klebsiella aerogenes]
MIKNTINIDPEIFDVLGLCCYQLLKNGHAISKNALAHELDTIRRNYVNVMGEWHSELDDAWELLTDSGSV